MTKNQLPSRARKQDREQAKRERREAKHKRKFASECMPTLPDRKSARTTQNEYLEGLED